MLKILEGLAGEVAELRGEVRYRAHQAGLAEVKEVATRVEEYALRHYVKLS